MAEFSLVVGAVSTCSYYDTWPEVYNAVEHIGNGCFAAGAGVPTATFMHSLSEKVMGIYRAAACFDTSSIPVGQTIYSAKLKGKYMYRTPWKAEYDIDTRVNFLKLSNLPCPGGSAAEAYASIRVCSDVIAQLYVAKTVTTQTAFERVFGTSGIAHINKGGRTDIAIRDIHDDPATPAEHTEAESRFYDLVLEVTYGEELIVVTLPATLVTNVSMQLNGEITAGSASKRGFDWGESIASLPYECVEEDSFGVEEFHCKIFGLNSGTQYCFRAKALP